MNPVNTKPYTLPPDATWLITGCSSDIGKAIALLITSKPSHRLIATARDPTTGLSYLPDSNPNILKLPFDVTSPSSVSNAFSSAASHFGADFYLDIVINNAGYSLSGDTEAAAEEETHAEMETLFFGTARVTTAASVSCFPVEGWTESVAREMHPDWNINFCIVEPSGVKTEFEGHSKAHITPHPAYPDADMLVRKLEKYVKIGLSKGGGAGLMEPKQVAEAIYMIASRGEKVPLRLPLGATAWKMAKAKFEGLLAEWEDVKRISAMGMEI